MELWQLRPLGYHLKSRCRSANDLHFSSHGMDLYSKESGEVRLMDKRVVFDFEIDFSNGGGLQGQGFRLDIEGEDISDEDLANYIVEDMRLLMVGEVRILNKAIIEEAHKRK